MIVWFTLTLNVWYLKVKMASFVFLGMEVYFFILFYQARHLQQIHWSKLLCGTAKSSVARLNICQILMRCRNCMLNLEYYVILVLIFFQQKNVIGHSFFFWLIRKVKGHLFSQWQIDDLLRYMAPKQFSETTLIIKTFKSVY